MALPGTWYGPDEGPDRRRLPFGPHTHTTTTPCIGPSPVIQSTNQPSYVHPNTRHGYSPRGYGSEPEVADPQRRNDFSDSGAFVALNLALLPTGGKLHIGSEDPDIDDLLAVAADAGDSRVCGSAGIWGAAALPLPLCRAPPSVVSVESAATTTTQVGSAPTWRLQVCVYVYLYAGGSVLGNLPGAQLAGQCFTCMRGPVWEWQQAGRTRDKHKIQKCLIAPSP